MKEGSSNLGIGCIHFTLTLLLYFVTFLWHISAVSRSMTKCNLRKRNLSAFVIASRLSRQKGCFFSSKPPQETNVPFCVLQHHLFSWNSTLKVQRQEIELVSKLVEALFHIHAMWSVHVPFPLPPSPCWSFENQTMPWFTMIWWVGRQERMVHDMWKIPYKQLVKGRKIKTSVSIFSILFFIHILWCLQGEYM